MISFQPFTFIFILVLIYLVLIFLSFALIMYCEYLINKNKCCLSVCLVAILASFLMIIPIKNGFKKNSIAPYQIKIVDVEVLKNNGAEILEKIDSFKKEHGSYPSKLSEISMDSESPKFANWKYRTYNKKNKAEYKLFVIDSKTNCILCWKSRKHQWMIVNS
jgi:hypothetical protein